MGLFDTIRNVFGLQRPLVVRDPATPFAVSAAALEHLRQLPEGQGLHLETVPVDRGRTIRVTEGDLQGPPPAVLGGLPITMSDRDLARLAGRELDLADGRWTVVVPLEVRARETPNPDSRLYLCDQVLAVGRPLFFVAGTELPDLPSRLLEVPGVRSVLLRDNTVTVERERDVPWDRLDRGVNAALREHLLLCGGPLEGGADSVSRDPLEDEIRKVLAETVLPAIHRDGGDLEVLGFSNGVLKVSMTGACRSCPASSATLRLGVEKTLRDAFPGRVERVEQV